MPHYFVEPAEEGMENSDIWMLIGMENWARTPPMLFPVDPLP